jgi:serine/threonine-protein kinase
VQVPDVVGETWDVAKPKLVAAGFALDYNKIADILPGSSVVTKTNPEGGTSADKGSKVKINFRNNGF